MPKKLYTIPFVYKDSEVPIVKFKLKNKTFFGLIDSGAELTVFSKSIKNYLDADLSDGTLIKLVSFGGESQNRFLKVRTDIKFIGARGGETCPITVKGIASDLTQIEEHFKSQSDNKLLISAVFGSDMLQSINARIDYDVRKLIFKI